MVKYWNIREEHGDRERDEDMSEDYECGYEDGYEDGFEDATQEMRNRDEDERPHRRSMKRGRSNSFVEGEDRGMLEERKHRSSMRHYK